MMSVSQPVTLVVHLLPHVPQLLLSLNVFTQTLLQTACPGPVQPETQAPMPSTITTATYARPRARQAELRNRLLHCHGPAGCGGGGE